MASQVVLCSAEETSMFQLAAKAYFSEKEIAFSIQRCTSSGRDYVRYGDSTLSSLSALYMHFEAEFPHPRLIPESCHEEVWELHEVLSAAATFTDARGVMRALDAAEARLSINRKRQYLFGNKVCIADIDLYSLLKCQQKLVQNILKNRPFLKQFAARVEFPRQKTIQDLLPTGFTITPVDAIVYSSLAAIGAAALFVVIKRHL